MASFEALMATWPHEPTLLSDAERSAYRNLLYDAMLDIRSLCRSRGRESRNPLEIWRQYRRSRLAGELADWLHNLAQHSAMGLTELDTEWFWREYDGLCRRHPEFRPGAWMDYKERYQRHLSRIGVAKQNTSSGQTG